MKENMLLNSNSSIELVLQGIENAAKIITSTMGGAGKNVLLFDRDNLIWTKDGVSVANRIGFQHTEHNAGAQLLINAANQTVQECGDGTTLTSLLTQMFVNKLFEEIKDRDVNDVLDEAQLLIDNLKQHLTNISTPIESAQTIFNIAFTSCKDQRLAEMIQQIFIKVGLDAHVSVELSNHAKETYLEYTEGLTMEEGYVNSQFATTDDGLCVLEKAQVIVEKDFINEVSEISDVIAQNQENGLATVFIAKGFSDHVIRFCLANIQRGFRVCLIKLPGWGEAINENIKDIRAFLNPSTFTCNRIVISPYKFTIFNNPNKTTIKRRVCTLTKMVENSSEEWEIKEYKNRIANIQQKSVIIYVGGITYKNAKEEFDRIEDAVGAVKSAKTLGFVKGAGISLHEYATNNNLPSWFYEVLIAPARKILSNANLNMIPTDVPYNTRTKQFDNNLIDPTMVLIKAFDNSFALTKLLINTSYILYES